MKLTQKQIEQINKEVPGDQGIFVQPSMIPVSIKEPVIYTRYVTGGKEGGWYGQGENVILDTIPSQELQDNLIVLDKVLEKLVPEITYLDYKLILKKLVKTSEQEERGYYGNYTDFIIKYIPLSALYRFLDKRYKQRSRC